MLRNYFAIALRNIRQSPLYAFINIFSLAIGLSACLVIYLFIKDERSFDAFHSKKENLYRLDEVQNFTGTNLENSGPLSAAERAQTVRVIRDTMTLTGRETDPAPRQAYGLGAHGGLLAQRQAARVRRE